MLVLVSDCYSETSSSRGFCRECGDRGQRVLQVSCGSRGALCLSCEPYKHTRKGFPSLQTLMLTESLRGMGPDFFGYSM